MSVSRGVFVLNTQYIWYWVQWETEDLFGLCSKSKINPSLPSRACLYSVTSILDCGNMYQRPESIIKQITSVAEDMFVLNAHRMCAVALCSMAVLFCDCNITKQITTISGHCLHWMPALSMQCSMLISQKDPTLGQTICGSITQHVCTECPLWMPTPSVQYLTAKFFITCCSLMKQNPKHTQSNQIYKSHTCMSIKKPSVVCRKLEKSVTLAGWNRVWQ